MDYITVRILKSCYKRVFNRHVRQRVNSSISIVFFSRKVAEKDWWEVTLEQLMDDTLSETRKGTLLGLMIFANPYLVKSQWK